MIIPSNPDPKANRYWKVTTEPVVEPLTVEEVKQFGRIDGVSEDTLITGFIRSARVACENYLRRALITQTIKVRYDWWPGERVELPRPPLISVTKVETLTEEDVSSTYSSDNYYVISEVIPGELVLKFGVTPPENTNRYRGGFRIEYIAGYGTDAGDVPQAIKDGLKLWVMDIYENRVVSDEPPPEARSYLDIFRVIQM